MKWWSVNLHKSWASLYFLFPMLRGHLSQQEMLTDTAIPKNTATVI